MIERHIPVEQAGWVNIGGRTWRLPDGACFTFKDGVEQVIRRFDRGPAPREYGRKVMPTAPLID